MKKRIMAWLLIAAMLVATLPTFPAVYATDEIVPDEGFAITGITVSQEKQWTQEKTVCWTLFGTDAKKQTKCFATSAKYMNLEELIKSTFEEGLVPLPEQSWTATANGTYYLYAIELEEDGNLKPDSRWARAEVKISFIDNTPPQINSAQQLTQGWASSVIVRILAEDEDSGIAEVSAVLEDGSEVQAQRYAQGDYRLTLRAESVRIKATDYVGLTTEIPFTINQLDTLPPMVTITDASEGWSNQDTFTATAKEETSGLSQIQYSVDGKTTTVQQDMEKSAEITFDVGKDGEKTVSVMAMDAAGNKSTAEAFVKIDHTAPTLSATAATEWQRAAAKVIVAAADGCSGIVKLAYSLTQTEYAENNEWKEFSGTEFFVSQDGIHTITIAAIDAAGNIGYDTVTVKIDRTAPSITTTENNYHSGWLNEPAKLVFSFTDETSGLSKIAYQTNTDDTTISDWTEIPLTGESTYALPLTVLEQGITHITVKAWDIAGNEETHEETVLVDTVPPTLTVTPAAHLGEWYTEKAVIQVSANDTPSGLATLSYSYLETEYDASSPNWIPVQDGKIQISEDGVYSLCIAAVDLAGNITYEHMITRVDKTKPSITTTKNNYHGGWLNTPAELTFAFAEEMSGLRKFAYRTTTNGNEPTEWVETELNDVKSYDFSLLLPMQGETLVEIKAWDAAGNEQSHEETVCVDTVVPALSITQVNFGVGWYNRPGQMTVHIHDETSGISFAAYAFTDSAFTFGDTAWNRTEGEGQKDLDITVDIPQNGVIPISFVASDLAGNQNSLHSTAAIDTEAPTAEITHRNYNSSAWQNTVATMSIKASDETSGIAWIAASETETSYTDTERWTKTSYEGAPTCVEWNYTVNTDGKHNVVIAICDNAGNITYLQDAIWLDFTAPVLEANILLESTYVQTLAPFGHIFQNAIPTKAHAEDATSGVSVVEYQLCMENATPEEASWQICDVANLEQTVQDSRDLTGRIVFRAKDNAGNITVVTAEAENETTVTIEHTPQNPQDFQAPSLKVSTQSGQTYHGKWTNQNVIIKASGTSFFTGTMRYEYQITYGKNNPSNSAWMPMPDALMEISEDANITVWVRERSNANHTGDIAYAKVQIQKTLPHVGSIDVNTPTTETGWYAQMPEWGITPAIAQASNAPITNMISWTIYDIGAGGALTEKTENFVYNGKLPKMESEGIYRVQLWSEDEAGNRSEETQTHLFRVDTVAPKDLRMTIDGQNVRSESAEFTHFYSSAQKMHVSANVYKNRTYEEIRLADLQLTSGNPLTEADRATAKQDAASATRTSFHGDLARLFNADQPCNGVLSMNVNTAGYWGLTVTDMSGNQSKCRTNGIILDDTAPSVLTAKPLQNPNSNGYYNKNVTVRVVLTEHPNLVSGNSLIPTSGIQSFTYEILANGVVVESGTKTAEELGRADAVTGSVNSATVDIPVSARFDANHISLRYTMTDRAGNRFEKTFCDINLDSTRPEIYIAYDNNTAIQRNGTTYFASGRTATITVTERNFDAARTNITFTDSDSGRVYRASNWTTNGYDHVATVCLSEDGHYTVHADATDLANNKVSDAAYAPNTIAQTEFVIDTTAPKLSVEYDNDDSRNGQYFAEPRRVTITVTERNFDAELVNIAITAADGGVKPAISEWTHNGNIHTATITFSADGTYTFRVSSTDCAGNRSTATGYNGSAPNHFVIDKEFDLCKITGVTNNACYTSVMSVIAELKDWNLDHYEMALYQITVDGKKTNVTEKYVAVSSETEEAAQILFEGLAHAKEEDGRYILQVTAVDKAGNSVSEEIHFVMNKFGSIYELSTETASLQNTYNQAVDFDLHITEYSPDSLTKRACIITRDGQPLDAEFTIETIAGEEKGKDEWTKTEYTIPSSNFAQDGVYSVAVQSIGRSGTASDSAADAEIRFTVDATTPELSAISLQSEIINAAKYDISGTIFDALGLDNVTIYTNGNEIFKQEGNGESQMQFTVTLEDGLHQTLRIVAVDRAGNVLDTDAEEYTGVKFPQTFTISDNLMVRIYANTPLFVTLVISIPLLTLTLLLVIISQRRKKAKTTKKAEKEDTQV